VGEAKRVGNVGAVAEDYCDLCDLPLSTCIHGMPAPPPAPAATPSVRTPRAPRAPRATATRKPSVTTSTKPSPVRKRTEQEAFRPFIVQLLKDEGRLEHAEVMELLEERMAEVLLDRDRQKAPTGEVRWHTAARAERKAMIDEGLIVPAQPGVWQLTERGKLVAY